MPTTLRGYSAATFSAGVQRAYRQAASEQSGVAVEKIALSNIRDDGGANADTARRRLATGDGVASVLFDTQFSVSSAAAAVDVRAAVDAVETAELKAELIAQLKAVQAAGEFADLAGVDVAAASSGIEITTADSVTAVMTAAPTPAPRPQERDTGAGGKDALLSRPVLVTSGALLLLALLLAVVAARRRRQRDRAALGGAAACEAPPSALSATSHWEQANPMNGHPPAGAGTGGMKRAGTHLALRKGMSGGRLDDGVGAGSSLALI